MAIMELTFDRTRSEKFLNNSAKRLDMSLPVAFNGPKPEVLSPRRNSELDENQRKHDI
jgi:hypothetical protein